jgi:hypothetical protein
VGGAGGAGGKSLGTITTGSGATPGNSGSAYLTAGLAVGGGCQTAGGNGLIVISYPYVV